MNGILYGVGVGPGDPELLTLKAARILGECQVIAAPHSGGGEQAALEIAREHIAGKPVLSLPMPMTRDQDLLRRSRAAAASLICRELAAGRDVAFLTLGDPAVYSTYSYLHRLVEEQGFQARMVPGVPSFCGAAAALGIPLCEGGEALHILPASYQGAEEALDLPGVRVLMKSGKALGELLALLGKKGLLGRAYLAQRVGMEGQRLSHPPDPGEEASYFSIVLVKPEEEGP